MADQQATKGGHPNKGSLQAYIQDFTKEAIDGMVNIMRTSNNQQLVFAAQKLIIDKSIADLKAMELGGPNGQPIQLTIIADKGFIPAAGQIITASVASSESGQSSVQGVDMAPEGTQNDNSNNGASQAGAS